MTDKYFLLAGIIAAVGIGTIMYLEGQRTQQDREVQQILGSMVVHGSAGPNSAKQIREGLKDSRDFWNVH